MAEGFAGLKQRRFNQSAQHTHRIMATRRLYYDDSFQREFTARVLSCDPVTVSPSRGERASTWQAILDQAVFILLPAVNRTTSERFVMRRFWRYATARRKSFTLLTAGSNAL